MAATNRAAKITKLISSLKKQYKPAAPAQDQPLLETLLLGCLLENSPMADAQRTLAALAEGYFDWNEVRVTTKTELAEACRALTDPVAAATRLKAVLQSAFEAFYTWDIDAMKKQNLGQSVKQLEKLEGASPFVVAFAVQNALGGHAIPVNAGLLTALATLEVITPAEAAAGTVPGLERAVPKNKGPEVGSLMHQLGVEVGKNPFGQTARKRLLALDPKCKERLPKRPAAPEPPAPAEEEPAAPHTTRTQTTKPDSKKPQTKKPDPKKPDPKGAAAKTSAAKAPAAKPAEKAAEKATEKPTPKKAAPAGAKKQIGPATKKGPGVKKGLAAKKPLASKKPASTKKSVAKKSEAPKKPAAPKAPKKATKVVKKKAAAKAKTSGAKKTAKRKPR